MKQKWTIKTKLLLVFAVLAIVFMMYSLLNLSPKKEILNQIATAKIDPINQTTSRQEFELLPMEKNPFFGAIRNKTVSKLQNTKKVTKETVQWPSITYNGVVESRNGIDQVYVLVVNGKQLLFEKGEIKDDIKLLAVGNKTLKISFQGKTKEIER